MAGATTSSESRRNDSLQREIGRLLLLFGERPDCDVRRVSRAIRPECNLPVVGVSDRNQATDRGVGIRSPKPLQRKGLSWTVRPGLS